MMDNNVEVRYEDLLNNIIETIKANKETKYMQMDRDQCVTVLEAKGFPSLIKDLRERGYECCYDLGCFDKEKGKSYLLSQNFFNEKKVYTEWTEDKPINGEQGVNGLFLIFFMCDKFAPFARLTFK